MGRANDAYGLVSKIEDFRKKYGSDKLNKEYEDARRIANAYGEEALAKSREATSAMNKAKENMRKAAKRREQGFEEINKKKELFEKLSKEDWQMLIAGMMGGIELGKYDGIDFTPPEGAREAAKRALDVRDKKPASQKGMTAVGIARARDLINGVKFSPDTVRRMENFFRRHEVDKKGSTWDEQGKG